MRRSASWGAVFAVVALVGCDDGVNPVRNSPPTVSVRASLSLVKAGLDVEFTAEVTDANGGVLSYRWDFGDGVELVGAENRVCHAFPAEGRYVVCVVVTNSQGLSGAGQTVIEVTPPGGPPIVTVESIGMSGVASDATPLVLTVCGAEPVRLEGREFYWGDDVGELPRSWSFKVLDRGGNSSVVTVSLAPTD